MNRRATADMSNTTRARRPLIEDADSREHEPGDFMVIELPLQGIRYQAATCYRLVGSNVLGAQGAFAGRILLVYLRVGFFG